jgi:hypothetical protein
MWTKRTLQLDKKVEIKARPGNNIFAANRGDVVFEYPTTWIVKPSDKSICFYDAEPPADQCVLEFSLMPLDFRTDWSRLPLAQMLCSSIAGPTSPPRHPAEVRQIRRGDMQIVWIESDFMDPVEHRLALSRSLLALRADVLPLITFSFWPEHKERWEPFWKDLLETLRLAEGQKFKQRN